MKILLVIGNLAMGGAQRVISIIANNLAEKDYEVGIITCNFNSKPAFIINQKVKIINIEVKGLPLIITIKTCIKLRDVIKNYNADVIISFMSDMNYITITATLGLRKPVIISERNDPNKIPSNIYKRIYRNIMYNFSNGFVFQTTDAMKYFNHKIQSRSIIILNPLEISKIPDRDEHCISNRIIAVNRLETQKNTNLLILAFSEIMKEIPYFSLDIYGEGSKRAELQELIDTLNLTDKVNLLGQHENILDVIKDGYMYVLTSDYEGMPNSLIEAMSLGLACISTDCPIGGPKMLIKNYLNGILVPVNDVNELKKAMIYVMKTKEIAIEMGNEAKKIRNLFSNDIIIEQWVKYIEHIKNRCKKL